MTRALEGNKARFMHKKMMRAPAGIKSGFIHIRAFIGASSAVGTLLGRLVERMRLSSPGLTRLDRATQYFGTLAIN
jgi:hypothetical protein